MRTLRYAFVKFLFFGKLFADELTVTFWRVQDGDHDGDRQPLKITGRTENGREREDAKSICQIAVKEKTLEPIKALLEPIKRVISDSGRHQRTKVEEAMAVACVKSPVAPLVQLPLPIIRSKKPGQWRASLAAAEVFSFA